MPEALIEGKFHAPPTLDGVICLTDVCVSIPSECTGVKAVSTDLKDHGSVDVAFVSAAIHPNLSSYSVATCEHGN